MNSFLLLVGLFLSSSHEGLAFTAPTLNSPPVHTGEPVRSSTSRWSRRTDLKMMQPSGSNGRSGLDVMTMEDDNNMMIKTTTRRRPNQELRAIAIDTMVGEVQEDTEEDFRSLLGFSTTSTSETPSETIAETTTSGVWQEVLSAASLVTGSTVGASMLVLPTLAAGPGLTLSSAMFLAVYLVVLTSGLVIADVAINQHESGYEVPSSFQEFAQANLDSEWIAKLISAVPIVVNSLVMIFDIGKGGEIGAAMAPSLGIDPIMGSVAFVSILGACLSTLSGSNLSRVASMCVTALLVSFGGLLIPGLANVQDPMGTIMAPGTAGDDAVAAMIGAAPIVLTALQFQNVVPSLTKILNYDRTKTVTAIAVGSFTPLLMYLAWTYAVLGGGIDTSGIAGPLFSLFSAAAVFGSATGAGMSVTEEVETTLKKMEKNTGKATAGEAGAEVFSLPAVLLSLSVPMAGVLACDDVNGALGIAGSFGSPLLYGVIPALMAWNQRQKIMSARDAQQADTPPVAKPLIPGGLASIGALGVASAMYIGEGLAQQVTGILS